MQGPGEPKVQKLSRGNEEPVRGVKEGPVRQRSGGPVAKAEEDISGRG